MKQKDIALILVMVFIGAVVAIIVSKFVFSSSSHQLTAEKVDPITSDFSSPPPKYFKSSSVNPTQLIQIGGNPNPNPFNNKSQ